MIIGSINLFISVLYFLTRTINSTDTSYSNRREKDCSMNSSVSIDYSGTTNHKFTDAKPMSELKRIFNQLKNKKSWTINTFLITNM